jgi:hypothetical protein
MLVLSVYFHCPLGDQAVGERQIVGIRKQKGAKVTPRAFEILLFFVYCSSLSRPCRKARIIHAAF